jgi:hypothetical protein
MVYPRSLNKNLWIRFKRSGFLSIFMRFVFLATLALYIPYSLLPETAMAHGISQVHQKTLWIRFKEGFFQHFLHFVFLATLALLHTLLTPPGDSHGTWYIPGPSKNSVDKI